MELGNHIKALRQQRGVTQETLAAALGVSAQAVSKWENQAAAPDIQLLPAISTYFGVTIDELFALSDETRMERIQNMIWDEWELDRVTAEREIAFLLEKGRREPSNGRVYELLANLENHRAESRRRKAAEYAKEALTREPGLRGAHGELVRAMGGQAADWYVASHHKLIDWYKRYLEKNPTDWRGHMWLIDNLIDDRRFDEARDYCERLAKIHHTFRGTLYRGLIDWYEGNRDEAAAIWEQMCRDHPDEWLVWFSMGDILARMGEYERAVAHYQKALKVQTQPRYVDCLASISVARELMGDIPGAIASLEEEIAVLAEDWDTTTGETVDAVRREIERLKGKQKAEG